MFKIIKSNSAQAHTAEYVIVLFIVVGAVVTMTMYLRRALAGRIRDAHEHMTQIAKKHTASFYNNGFFWRYSPYYANQITLVARNGYEKSMHGAGGVFHKTFGGGTAVKTNSTTLPPKDGDKNSITIDNSN